MKNPNTSISINAISWFEIGVNDLNRADAFYAAVLGRKMLRRESMGPSEGSIFGYAGDGVGGALMCGPSAPPPGAGGTLIYLDASPSIDAALARVSRAGGTVALPKQALPPGMGFIAHVTDPDGNHIGLHALA
jgi:predicted enzyme related to lactoylglutathione lyase